MLNNFLRSTILQKQFIIIIIIVIIIIIKLLVFTLYSPNKIEKTPVYKLYNKIKKLETFIFKIKL